MTEGERSEVIPHPPPFHFHAVYLASIYLNVYTSKIAYQGQIWASGPEEIKP